MGPHPTVMTVDTLVDAGFDPHGIAAFTAGFAKSSAIESALSVIKGTADGPWANLPANDALGWLLYCAESDGRLPTTPFVLAHPQAWLPWAAGLNHEEITAGNLPCNDTLRAMAALRGHCDTAQYLH